MRTLQMIVLTMALLFIWSCARRIPEPLGLVRGTPHVSWVIMTGDRRNPDKELVCQSDPRNDCVFSTSRPEAEVFANVHLYYHGVGGKTTYTGSIGIGFFEDAHETHQMAVNTTVNKAESIKNQSVSGAIASQPGRYPFTVTVVGTSSDTKKTQSIQDSVAVVVR
jgi:hypothetical protein